MTPDETRTARKHLGLTQAELSSVMGYGDKARVSELERGVKGLSPAAARLLQAYLEGYRPPGWPPAKATPRQA